MLCSHQNLARCSPCSRHGRESNACLQGRSVKGILVHTSRRAGKTRPYTLQGTAEHR